VEAPHAGTNKTKKHSQGSVSVSVVQEDTRTTFGGVFVLVTLLTLLRLPIEYWLGKAKKRKVRLFLRLSLNAQSTILKKLHWTNYI
jgi:hypothetical protein